MTEWISVECRLPQLKPTNFKNHYESDPVLIWHESDDSASRAFSPWISYMYIYGDMNDAQWGLIGDLGIGRITHWMPLPEAPIKFM